MDPKVEQGKKCIGIFASCIQKVTGDHFFNASKCD